MIFFIKECENIIACEYYYTIIAELLNGSGFVILVNIKHKLYIIIVSKL